MKEKASSKESGEDQFPRVDPDAPGLSPGEELTIDPVSGDEIDPIRKWWDEAEATSNKKTQNRRIEELEAGAEGILDAEGRALPRRRKRPEPPTIEVDEIPGLTGPKVTMPPLASIAVEESAELVPAVEAPAVVDDDARSLDSSPLAHLKRRAREESDAEAAFDLSELFAETNDGEGAPAPAEREEAPAHAGSVEIPLEGPAMEKKVVLSNEEKEVLSLDVGDSLQSESVEEPSALLFEFPDFEDEPVPAAEADVPVVDADKAATVEDGAPPAADEVIPEEGQSDQSDPKADPRTEIMVVVAVEETVTETNPLDEIVALSEDTISARSEEAKIGEETGETDPPEKVADLKEADSSPAEDSVPTPVPISEAAPAPTAAVISAAAAELPVTRKKAGCWTMFATLFFFVTLLLIVGLGVAGWFAWSRLGDFENEVTTRVRSGLEERGIYLDYGDWGYRFPRGLVFDEVTIYDDATRERPLIKVAGLGINVDLIGLAKAPGEIGAGEINLQDSTISLFEAGNPVTTIEGVAGEIFASQESVRVDRLTALLGGWQDNLSGLVTLPATTGEKEPAEASASAAKPAAAPLTLDFSAIKALEPWLAVASASESAPVLNLTFAMDAAQPDLARIEGNLHGQDITWNGITFSSATATFHVVPETGELSVPTFQIGHGQGFIGGRLAIDTATQRLRIEQLQSTVDVLALLAQYKPAWAESWKSIRLVDAPSLQITGEVPLEDPAGADLKVRYDHRQGIVLALEKGDLPLRDLRGNFTVNRGSVETNDGGFELFGGSVQLNGATRLTDESRPFNGLIEITGLSLEKAAAFFGKKDSAMSGRLSFVFRGVGYREIEKVRGGGTLRVEEAIIPDFPILGQIQDYVGRAVPAFGVKGQGNIAGAYIIESGVLVASDLTVANSAARIVTNGSVNLSSLETNFTAKADLVPSLAAATGLTDKAITFEGKGPLGDPTVVMKSFPIEFASVSLGSILGTSPLSLGTLQIVPGVKETVGAFADQLGGPGITIHPEVMTFFKSLLGEAAPAPEPPQEQPAE